MARPLRIEGEGLTYHVTARGSGRMDIYTNDLERRHFLAIVGEVAETEDLACHAYCLMPNHYHLVVTTARANLSRAFRQVNGRYAQWWNRKRDRVGHVFQGRFWSQVVQYETYFATVCRYVVLNPERAGLVAKAEDWPWSSYRATVGLTPRPSFLNVEQLLGRFSDCDEPMAAARFAEFVGRSGTLTPRLRSAPVLGDELFVRRFRPVAERASREVPRRRALGRPALETVFAGAVTRAERAASMVRARREGYRLVEIARFLGLHHSTVSKAITITPSGVRS